MRDKQFYYMRFLVCAMHICGLLSAAVCIPFGIWLWESGKITILFWGDFVILCITAGILISFLLNALVLHFAHIFLKMQNAGNPDTPSALRCASALQKYKELLDQNAITAEEFETIKRALFKQIED